MPSFANSLNAVLTHATTVIIAGQLHRDANPKPVTFTLDDGATWQTRPPETVGAWQQLCDAQRSPRDAVAGLEAAPSPTLSVAGTPPDTWRLSVIAKARRLCTALAGDSRWSHGAPLPESRATDAFEIRRDLVAAWEELSTAIDCHRKGDAGGGTARRLGGVASDISEQERIDADKHARRYSDSEFIAAADSVKKDGGDANDTKLIAARLGCAKKTVDRRFGRLAQVGRSAVTRRGDSARD